jgi:O-antigen/teichoic acid export membrane protein
MVHIASTRQFSRNMVSGWVLLVAEVGVAFMLTPFVIAHLGAATYGVWALLIGLVGYMGLVDVGLRGSVGRYVNHYMALHQPEAVAEVIGTANVVLSALAALALLLALGLAFDFRAVFPKTPEDLASTVQFCLPLLALNLWLQFLGSVLANLLSAREATYLVNHFSLGLLVLRTAATVGALLAGYKLEALVLITLLLSALNVLLTWRAARRLLGAEMPALARFRRERLTEMWRFGVATFAGRTSATLANDSAPIIGMWVLGPEAVAVYSVAMTLTQYVRRLIEQAGTAIFPSVMKAGAMRDFAGLRAVHLRYMNVSFAVGSLVFIGSMVFAGDFLVLWVGPQYQAGGWVVAILAFGYLMQGVAGTAPLTLASLDRVGVTMRIGIAEALACVVLTAALPGILGPALGLAGMALGSTLPRLVTGCLLYPRLAVATMGPELRAPLLHALRQNLLLCAGVAVAFAAIHWALPGTSWARLVAGVALVTLLHLSLLGHRYEVSGAGRLHELLAGWLRRRPRERT